MVNMYNISIKYHCITFSTYLDSGPSDQPTKKHGIRETNTQKLSSVDTMSTCEYNYYT